MFPYFILGIALLLGLVLVGRWFAGAQPGQIAGILRWVGGTLLTLASLYLVASERWGLLPLVLFLLVAVFPNLRRALGLGRMMRNLRGPTPGQTSNLETRFLRMRLEHDSGALDGEVLHGPHAGRRLSGLELGELVDVLEQCRAEDEESARVLEAYLDRAHPSWREQGAEVKAPGDGKMTREEAFRILGLEPGASESEVKEAHRRLMAKIHPDHGGSTYLAAKINQAKDVLLGV